MWWVWMALAGIFIMGEVFRHGSFFLWLGFGAAAAGIFALLDIQTPGQIAVFINISGILILLERRFLERYTFKQPLKKAPSRDDPVDINVFRRAGAGWEIKYGGKSYSIRHSKGLIHIRNLIIKNGEWIPCSVLKKLSSDDVSENMHEQYATMTREQLEIENLRVEEGIPPEDIITRLSLEKIKKLRDALVERKAVDGFNSPEEKIDQLNTLDFIEKYLKKITNNKGRPRKLHDQTDTDRKAVSAAINRCRNNLKEHKELYTHFKSFIIAEGNAFRYLPDRPVDWKTE
jgi:membrane protein implicated in regulation of membrane protease activity